MIISCRLRKEANSLQRVQAEAAVDTLAHKQARLATEVCLNLLSLSFCAGFFPSVYNFSSCRIGCSCFSCCSILILRTSTGLHRSIWSAVPYDFFNSVIPAMLGCMYVPRSCHIELTCRKPNKEQSEGLKARMQCLICSWKYSPRYSNP